MRYLRPLLLSALLSACAPIAATAQNAPSVCAARADILSHLQSRFGETVRSTGLVGSDRIIEVHASEETGSWTITVTNTNGVTCLLASGGYFEAVAQIATGDPA